MHAIGCLAQKLRETESDHSGVLPSPLHGQLKLFKFAPGELVTRGFGTSAANRATKSSGYRFAFAFGS